MRHGTKRADMLLWRLRDASGLTRFARAVAAAITHEAVSRIELGQHGAYWARAFTPTAHTA